MAHPAVVATNLSKTFHRPFPRLRKMIGRDVGGVHAVRGVNLEIQQGEIFGLVGRNGQGKTTLIKMMATLIQPTSGSVQIFGVDAERNQEQVKQMIGLVSADERSFQGRLTGRQNLMFFSRLYGLSDRVGRARILEVSRLLDFDALLDRRFQELSSGNKQRLALIRALLIEPRLLLLDEPTRSLDPFAAEQLRRLIHDRLNGEKGMTVLITSHNLEEVESLCDRIGILHAGQIRLSATMDELRGRFLNIEKVSVQLAGVQALNGLGSLTAGIPTLEWRELGEGRWLASFQRVPGDDQLDQFIEGAKANGSKIEACHAVRPGLREILEIIDSGRTP